MAKLNYNFDKAVRGVDKIPAPVYGSFRSGPAEDDKPFLDFVIKTLREDGNGGMPFGSAKERTMAQYRIHRWIRKEHDLPVRIHFRTLDGEHWLYWELDEDSVFDGESSGSDVPSADDVERPATESESDGGVFLDGVEDASRW